MADMEGYTLGSQSKNSTSRQKKAQKIVKIISEHKTLKGTNVLDIGTGAGYIAHALSQMAKKVESVDIIDDRIIKSGYRQTLVKDEALPFKDGYFDVVVTNQVLEHVPDQHKHLMEIRRVLKEDGIVYLATPNKWWLTDPHYKLPFISWLPRGLASIYLKYTKGRKWDIYSVSLLRLHQLAKATGLQVVDKTWQVMSRPNQYESSMPRIVSLAMRSVLKPLKPLLLNVVPTHIKVLKAIK